MTVTSRLPTIEHVEVDPFEAGVWLAAEVDLTEPPVGAEKPGSAARRRTRQLGGRDGCSWLAASVHWVLP